MNFKQFMNMYESLEVVVRGNTVDVMECLVPIRKRANVESYDELFNMEVVSFGFYDNELCVRVRHSIQQSFKKFCKKISENSENSIDK